VEVRRGEGRGMIRGDLVCVFGGGDELGIVFQEAIFVSTYFLADLFRGLMGVANEKLKS